MATSFRLFLADGHYPADCFTAKIILALSLVFYFMHLDKNKFALAGASVMGVVYLVCVIFVSLWPQFALQLFGWLVHLIAVDKYATDMAITWPGFIVGLIQVIIYTYIITWLFASLHNRFITEK